MFLHPFTCIRESPNGPPRRMLFHWKVVLCQRLLPYERERVRRELVLHIQSDLLQRSVFLTPPVLIASGAHS